MIPKKYLNLGCGNDIKKSTSDSVWVNLDSQKKEGVDVVWDLNKYPWPFKDNTFDLVYCSNILEYPQRLDLAMKQLERITKPEGIIEIISPYVKSDGAFKHMHIILEDTPLTYFDHSILLSVQYICSGGFRKFLPFKKILSLFLWNIYDFMHLRVQIKK